MEYKAEDYIDFIESGRRDKILEELVYLFPNDTDLGSYIRKLVNSERENFNNYLDNSHEQGY